MSCQTAIAAGDPVTPVDSHGPIAAKKVVRIKRLMAAAAAAILISALLGGREGRADPPSCFPERTVLWAAQFVDGKGNAFGGIRAGHLVRVLDDFAGPGGDQALIEVDQPVRVQAMVPRRLLVAFTRQELEYKGGFSRWVAGAPVIVGKLEEALPRLFLADPHCEPKESRSITSPCSEIRGSIAQIGWRDRCHGARPATTATIHGEQRAFWKKPTPLKALSGREVVTIPAQEWVYLVDRGKDRSVIEYRDWSRHTLYSGQAPTKGMRYVPSGLAQGGDHLCCEGMLLFRPAVPVSKGHDAVILSSASIRAARNGEFVATLNKGLRVRVVRDQDDMAFVVYRWPTWDDADYTFQLHGWIDKKTLCDAVEEPHPTKAGPQDAAGPGADEGSGARGVAP